MAQNNGDLFDTYGITKMLEAINNNFQQNNSLANNEFAQQMLDKMEKLVGAQDKLTAKDIEKVFKEIFNPFLRGVYGGNTELTNALKILKSEIKELSNKQNVSTKLFSNMLTGGTSLMYSASSSAIRNGSGSKFFNLSNPKDELTAASLAKIFGEQSKTANLLTSIQDKILSFFNENKSQEKTKRRQFIDDLVDGLSKSKWIGGAIMDLFKLASFFAANWLKNFGPIGKALAVGIIAAAPLIGAKMASIISNAIVKGLTNVVKTGLTGLGALFRAAFSEKAIAGLTRGGALAGGALALAGAGALGSYAVNTWNEGGARNKWAGGLMGAGALGLGALGVSGLIAAIAPAFGATLIAAIAPIAAPVAIIATGAGLIVKFWPQIMNFLKSVLEWLGIIAEKDEEGGYRGGAPTLFEGWNDDFAGEKGVKLKSQGRGKLGEKDLAAWKKANTTKAIVGADGAIMNFGQMTQEQAGLEMERVRKENPTAWNELYEFIPFTDKSGRVYGRKDSFGTDLISPDGTGFYAAKGSKARLDAANAYLESKGYRGALEFSGAIGTAGNFARKIASPHNLTGKGHDSPYAAKYDIGQQSMASVVNARGERASVGLIDEALTSEEAWYGAKIRSESDHRDLLWVSGDTRTKVRGYKEKKKEIIEAAQTSIALKQGEAELMKTLADVDKNNGLTTSQNIEAEKSVKGELAGMKKDLEELRKTYNSSFSVTGMKELSNRMKSKPFQDLMGNALIAPDGGN